MEKPMIFHKRLHLALVYSSPMKSLPLLFFIFMVGVSFGFSENCQTASSVPAGQGKLASGTVVPDIDGVVSIKGGQSVYVKIKNDTDAEASYEVMLVVENPKPAVTNCMYRATLQPNTSAVILGTLSAESAETPIPWQVSVAMESEEGVLRYEVYSVPKKNSSTKSNVKASQ
jgi:hypothetical protein